MKAGTIFPIIFVAIIIITIVGLFIYHVIMYPHGRRK
jgi:hypothetical protein